MDEQIGGQQLVDLSVQVAGVKHEAHLMRQTVDLLFTKVATLGEMVGLSPPEPVGAEAPRS